MSHSKVIENHLYMTKRRPFRLLLCLEDWQRSKFNGTVNFQKELEQFSVLRKFLDVLGFQKFKGWVHETKEQVAPA